MSVEQSNKLDSQNKWFLCSKIRNNSSNKNVLWNSEFKFSLMDLINLRDAFKLRIQSTTRHFDQRAKAVPKWRSMDHWSLREVHDSYVNTVVSLISNYPQTSVAILLFYYIGISVAWNKKKMVLGAKNGTS